MANLLDVISLAELRCNILRMKEDRQWMAERHAQELAAADRRIAKAVEEFESVRKGLDPARVARAESVLEVTGRYASAGDDRGTVIEDAINDLADNDGAKLAEVRFGTKDYAQWHGQRCDCAYGYGPKHGHIIFAVSLSAQKRAQLARGESLTEQDIEDALYYLANLKEIQASRDATD